MPESKRPLRSFRGETAYGREYFRRLQSMPDGAITDELKTGKVDPAFRDPVEVSSKDLMPAETARGENRFFNQLQALLPNEDWEDLVEICKKIDINEDYEIKGRGMVDGVEVFMEFAADLKEFDGREFRQTFPSLEKEWLEVKSYIETIRDNPVFLLDFFTDVKALYPDKFSRGEISLDQKELSSIVQALESQSAQQNWGEFVNLYSKAASINKEEITRLLPIGQNEWKGILEWVESQKKQGYLLFCYAVALAQAARSEGAKEIIVTADDWNSCVNEMGDKYRREKNPRRFIQQARSLKYLEVEPPLEV